MSTTVAPVQAAPVLVERRWWDALLGSKVSIAGLLLVAIPGSLRILQLRRAATRASR